MQLAYRSLGPLPDFPPRTESKCPECWTSGEVTIAHAAAQGRRRFETTTSSGEDCTQRRGWLQPLAAIVYKLFPKTGEVTAFGYRKGDFAAG